MGEGSETTTPVAETAQPSTESNSSLLSSTFSQPETSTALGSAFSNETKPENGGGLFSLNNPPEKSPEAPQDEVEQLAQLFEDSRRVTDQIQRMLNAKRGESSLNSPNSTVDPMDQQYGIMAKANEKPAVKVEEGRPDFPRTAVEGGAFDAVKDKPFQIYEEEKVNPIEPAPVSTDATPVSDTLTPTAEPAQTTEDKPEEKKKGGGGFGKWFHRGGKALAGPAIGAVALASSGDGGIPSNVPPAPAIERGLDVAPLVQTPDLAAQPTVPETPGVPFGPEQPKVDTITNPATGQEVPVSEVKLAEAGVGSPEDKEGLKDFSEVRQFAGNAGNTSEPVASPMMPSERTYAPDNPAAEQAVNTALGIGTPTPAETPAAPSETPAAPQTS